jgi:hypothetical protein
VTETPFRPSGNPDVDRLLTLRNILARYAATEAMEAATAATIETTDDD